MTTTGSVEFLDRSPIARYIAELRPRIALVTRWLEVVGLYWPGTVISSKARPGIACSEGGFRR